MKPDIESAFLTLRRIVAWNDHYGERETFGKGTPAAATLRAELERLYAIEEAAVDAWSRMECCPLCCNEDATDALFTALGASAPRESKGEQCGRTNMGA